MAPKRLRSRVPGAIVRHTMRPGARFPSLASRLPSAAIGCAVACAAVLVSSCGHPASSAECEELLARIAEITLHDQNITDPKVIAERTAAFRQARGQDLLGSCAGKRITDNAMQCVRKAATVEEVHKCLD